MGNGAHWAHWLCWKVLIIKMAVPARRPASDLPPARAARGTPMLTLEGHELMALTPVGRWARLCLPPPCMFAAA